MVFAIKAYSHEIPSTTVDEHVVIGGNYFDVLNSTCELEALVSVWTDVCFKAIYYQKPTNESRKNKSKVIKV